MIKQIIIFRQKKYHPDNKVPVREVRELKGTIPFGAKGILITTSDYTSDGIKESDNDVSKPVILLNGKGLVVSCIDKGIGFVYKPIFSKTQLDIFTNKNERKLRPKTSSKPSFLREQIEKTITKNDVRARIISIPSSIIKQFNESDTHMIVFINCEKEYYFSINRTRNYFAGVTEAFRDFGLLSEEGLIISKSSNWSYDKIENKVYINIED